MIICNSYFPCEDALLTAFCRVWRTLPSAMLAGNHAGSLFNVTSILYRKTVNGFLALINSERQAHSHTAALLNPPTEQLAGRKQTPNYACENFPVSGSESHLVSSYNRKHISRVCVHPLEYLSLCFRQKVAPIMFSSQREDEILA